MKILDYALLRTFEKNRPCTMKRAAINKLRNRYAMSNLISADGYKWRKSDLRYLSNPGNTARDR